MGGPIVDEDQLWELTGRAGLDEVQVREVIRTGRPEQVVTRDLAMADQRGVRGMPTTFINDRRLEGTVSLERLLSIVDEIIGRRDPQYPPVDDRRVDALPSAPPY